MVFAFIYSLTSKKIFDDQSLELLKSKGLDSLNIFFSGTNILNSLSNKHFYRFVLHNNFTWYLLIT